MESHQELNFQLVDPSNTQSHQKARREVAQAQVANPMPTLIVVQVTFSVRGNY